MSRESDDVTNPYTAQAATQPYQGLLRPILLIGIFRGGDGDHVLVRTRADAIVRLDLDIPNTGLTLTGTGDGWAMVAEGDEIHRLVIG